MNEQFIKDINSQKNSDLYNTYNEILETIKLLESNIKELPNKEAENAK